MQRGAEPRRCPQPAKGERGESRDERAAKRRREGYPPEGSRPRSGLDRVARSRSDAPNLIARRAALVSVIGPIGILTVSTGGICVARIVTITIIGSIAEITGGIAITATIASTRCALPSSTARR